MANAVRSSLLACVLFGLGSTGSPARGQAVPPWVSFADPATDAICDVVNAANAELVVSLVTGELILISGDDIILDETFVDDNAQVFFAGEPAGIIDFYTDGDGHRTLWWTTLTGYAIAVEGFTGEPLETADRPAELDNAVCDACPLWDDPTVCEEPEEPPVVTIDVCGTGVEVPVTMSLATLALTCLCRRRGI